jgi:type IV pilus assembly protein PilB
MGRPEANRERIGDMLVASGLINSAQLSEALQAQRGSRLPLGKQLVALGHVSEGKLIQVLSNQLSVPWVSMERVEFPGELLSLLPADIVDRYTVMPVYVRNARGRGDTLYVAMDDPTDDAALLAIANATGLKVRAMIASPTELRNAIEERYFGKRPASQPPTSRTAQFLDESSVRIAKPGARPPPPRSRDDEHKAKPPPPPPKSPATRAEGAVPVDQYAAPSNPPGEGAAARTLTLLDGTRIKLPTNKKGGATQSITRVRHVVKAVSAASAELGAGHALRWHDIVQALIDAATARGVILTRKELGQAWTEARQREAEAQAAKSAETPQAGASPNPAGAGRPNHKGGPGNG